jgi:LysM domain
MSALSAIETPVGGAQGPARPVTTDFGQGDRALRVVASREQAIAAQGSWVTVGEGQPRSSSIPMDASKPFRRQRTDPRVVRATAVVTAPGSVQAQRPVAVGVRLGSARAGVSSPRARARAADASDARTAQPVAVVPGSVISSLQAPLRATSDVPRARLRLTRRGRVVVAALVLVGATIATLLITMLVPGGAQATNHGSARGGYQGMHQVVVRPGQTLWSIAAAAEPAADPRAVVQEIMSANALTDPAVSAGQLLWVP